MDLSTVLTPAPEGGYIAHDPETGTTTQGETVEEALANLREATEFYLDELRPEYRREDFGPMVRSKHVQHLEDRAQRGSKEQVLTTLNRSPDVEPEEFDRL